MSEKNMKQNIDQYCRSFCKKNLISEFIVIVSIRHKLASTDVSRRKAVGCRFKGQVPTYLGYIDK